MALPRPFGTFGPLMPLSGTPQTKVVLSDEDVARLQSAFESALQNKGKKAVREIAKAAQETLFDLEMGLGHERLADAWQYTPVEQDRDQGRFGYLFSEIYSEIEKNNTKIPNKTTVTHGERPKWAIGRRSNFIDFDRTWDRVDSDRHFVDGEDLVAYLEYGVGTHKIPGPGGIKSDEGRLVFPVAVGVHASVFKGAHFTGDSVLAASFKGPPADALFVGLMVDHPGFAGNHNIENAYQIRLQALSRAADNLGRDIVDDFDGRRVTNPLR